MNYLTYYYSNVHCIIDKSPHLCLLDFLCPHLPKMMLCLNVHIQSLTNVTVYFQVYMPVYLHIYIHIYVQVAHNFDTFYITKLKFGMIFTLTNTSLDGSVGCASDWRPGGPGSTPAKVGNILSCRLIMKYFLRSFSPFR